MTAGAVVAGGIAWASIPDSGGVIHGCYGVAGFRSPSPPLAAAST